MKIGKVAYILGIICCLACMLFLFLFHNAAEKTANIIHHQEVVLPKAELPQLETPRMNLGKTPKTFADAGPGRNMNKKVSVVAQSSSEMLDAKGTENDIYVNPEADGIKKEREAGLKPASLIAKVETA